MREGPPQSGRILVVDDNEMNRDMLSRRLRRLGHAVETAVHGRHALERLAAEPYDLILLDIMMPEMNGYEVLQRLKADDALRHIPVVLISALDDAESVIQGIDLGADDHLPKPFNPQILQARVSACLAKKRLRDQEQVLARALQREFDIAREIQAGFLPERLPTVAGWELAARFRPARQVAGDFYDVFPLPGGERIALVVADVCDKGVGAALFMALFRSLLRALATQPHGPENGTASGGSDATRAIPLLLGRVNDYIAETHGSANMFATIFFGVLDPRTGELVYGNGGHDAPVVMGPGGVRTRLAPTGPAVGMLAGLEFATGRTDLRPGETLLAYTDGVVDARGEAGHAFSEERLLELVAGPIAGAGELLDRIDAAVRDHVGDAGAFDDVTLLAVRRC
jgi:phosphoserine phosphatase RsbU/P